MIMMRVCYGGISHYAFVMIMIIMVNCFWLWPWLFTMMALITNHNFNHHLYFRVFFCFWWLTIIMLQCKYYVATKIFEYYHTTFLCCCRRHGGCLFLLSSIANNTHILRTKSFSFRKKFISPRWWWKEKEIPQTPTRRHTQREFERLSIYQFFFNKVKFFSFYSLFIIKPDFSFCRIY